MAFEIEELQFSGLANEVAEAEFAASFASDADNTAMEQLFKSYCDAGKPVDQRTWLRKQLAELFQCSGERPDWIESTSPWPFSDAGEPMTYIGRIDVGENLITSNQVASNVALYVFGIRTQVDGGWEMRYQVVEQHRDLSSA